MGENGSIFHDPPPPCFLSLRACCWFTWQMLAPSLNKKWVFCITITGTIYLLMCNASDNWNKLIATSSSTKKKHRRRYSMVLMYGLMRICRPKARKRKKRLNNSIIGTQTRTDCWCCIAYQVVKCEREHDEIVWNTTKSHCNQSLLTQQRGSLPPARRWSSASPDSLISRSFQHQRLGKAFLPFLSFMQYIFGHFLCHELILESQSLDSKRLLLLQSIKEIPLYNK